MHRNDKRSDCGGVLIAVKECHNQNKVYIEKTGVVQWFEVSLKKQNKIYIGGFYWIPNHYDNELVKLETSLNKIMDISKNNPNSTIFIGGDFNASNISARTSQAHASNMSVRSSQAYTKIMFSSQVNI